MKVIIVGTGAFGLSTALYIQRHHRDTIDVLLLDGQTFPSIDSASCNDTSRAIRPDYGDPFYAKLGQETVNAWKTDKTFANHYRQSGRLAVAGPGDDFLNGCRSTLSQMGNPVEDFGGGNKIGHNLNQRWKGFGGEGTMKGWDAYFNPEAGWANPRSAIISAMGEYLSLGGLFIGDPRRGHVTENIISTENGFKKITGVKVLDGFIYMGDTVIYATGALCQQTDLIPGLGTQIYPIGFAIAHWKFTDPNELATWLDHPVVDIHHMGYFFPPDATSGVMKLGLGVFGFGHGERNMRPRSSLVGTKDEGRIPLAAENGIRSILRQVAPGLADKPFFDTAICWDAMTPDGRWLIDHHPGIQGLCVALGGSGHGFKFLPVVGKYVCESLGLAETDTPATMSEEMKSKWAWGRPENLNKHDRRVVLQGRPVHDISKMMRDSNL